MAANNEVEALATRFKNLAAKAETEWLDERVREQFRCSARGRQNAFEEAAEMLEATFGEA